MLLISVSACAAAGGGWSRAGASEEQAANDLADCQQIVREQTQTRYAIDTDIAATRGPDWARAGVINTERQRLVADDAAMSTKLMDGCMTARGYHRSGT